MVQKFSETAENHMNVNFRDKNFMIATIFRDSCYSRPPFKKFKIFVKNIFVMRSQITKIMKILCHGNLELYGIFRAVRCAVNVFYVYLNIRPM